MVEPTAGASPSLGPPFPGPSQSHVVSMCPGASAEPTAGGWGEEVG